MSASTSVSEAVRGVRCRAQGHYDNTLRKMSFLIKKLCVWHIWLSKRLPMVTNALTNSSDSLVLVVVPEGGLSAGPVCQSLRSLSPGGAFTEVIKGEFVFIPTTAHRSRPVSGQRELCAALRVSACLSTRVRACLVHVQSRCRCARNLLASDGKETGFSCPTVTTN